MSNHDISSPPEAGIHSERRVWGPWATAGFGIVVLIVFFITQTIVMMVFTAVKIYSSLDPSLGPPQFDEMMNAAGEVLWANAGLITSLATFASMIVCVGFILSLSRSEKLLVSQNILVSIPSVAGISWLF